MSLDAQPIHLDGTTLEGGGQLLRLSLCLSSLARIPIHLTDIRGNRGPGSRSKRGQRGGMKQAHLVGAEWLAKATGAVTEGMELKSRHLRFSPSQREGSVWTSVFQDGHLVRRESSIKMDTAGSIFLVLQAVLPYILFSPSSEHDSAAPSSLPAVSSRLSITGGTNTWHSLSYEYADQVLFPMLHFKLGIGPISMKLDSRGWSAGRTGSIGKVVFDITPLKMGQKLPAFSFRERGHLKKILVTILANSARMRADIREEVTRKLLHRYPAVELEYPVDEDTRDEKRLYLLLVAETSSGYRLGRDWFFDHKIEAQKPEKTVEKLVTKVVGDLRAELAHGGCVDEYLQDQLVVFQALAEGRSIVQGGKPCLHAETAHWVASTMLGIRFDHGNCEGIGFAAGQRSWQRAEAIKDVLD